MVALRHSTANRRGPDTDDRIALVELLQKSCDRDFSEL